MLKSKAALFLIVLIYLFSIESLAQEKLFDSEEILELNMQLSIKDLRTESNDSTYMKSVLSFKTSDGSWDTLDVSLRVRGNFRKQNCYYPPVRMKVKKKQAKESLFQGNRSLKIVFPCSKSKNADDLIAKEFLCYQLYEQVTKYTFHTRLIKINFLNEDDKKGEVQSLLGFLIEDDDEVAERFDGEIIENKHIIGAIMEDSSSVRHDFFQYMIGNTDWSSMYQHNMKILKIGDKTVIPLAYDFDMTGMVMPPYAQVSNLVDIKSVDERLYRGFCRDEEIMQTVRQEFLDKEVSKYAEIDKVLHLVDQSEAKYMKSYLADFFKIMKNDRSFNANILQACRSASNP